MIKLYTVRYEPDGELPAPAADIQHLPRFRQGQHRFQATQPKNIPMQVYHMTGDQAVLKEGFKR